MHRIGKVCGVVLLGIIVTGMTLWGVGALSYSPLPTPFREGLAAAFGLATAGAFLGLSHRRRTLLGFVLVSGRAGTPGPAGPGCGNRTAA